MKKITILLVFLMAAQFFSCESAPVREDDPVERSSYRTQSRNTSSGMKGRCRDGDYEACYKYGLRSYLGKKVRKDYKKAGRMFYRACEGKYMRACYALGIMYKNGKGTAKNCDNADKYFEIACDGGHQKACDKLWTCKSDPERDESYDEYDDYDSNDDYDDEEGYSEDNDYWDEDEDEWADF